MKVYFEMRPVSISASFSLSLRKKALDGPLILMCVPAVHC